MSDPLDLELHVGGRQWTQVLKTELGSSVGAVHTLNCYAMSSLRPPPLNHREGFVCVYVCVCSCLELGSSC